MPSLNSIKARLQIRSNKHLIDISELQDVSFFLGGFFYIQLNENLSDCAIQSICNYVSTQYAGISDNAPGCNSAEEVDSICNLIGIESFETEPVFSISPNPANTTLNLNLANGTLDRIEIYSQTGQLFQKAQTNKSLEQVDISGLPAGTFFIRAISRDGVFVRKFVPVQYKNLVI